MTEDSIPPLTDIYFYLTEGCNLACRHCWIAPKFDKDGTHYASLTPELFETVISEAKPLGLNAVKLTGGEPLLNPHFTRLLDICHAEDLAVRMETNGLLCTAKIAEHIARMREPFVSVSIDGTDAATHEWIRGVPGSFDKACNAVRHLAAAGLKPQVIMTLMQSNVEQMGAMVDLAESLGAGSLKFNLVQPTERGKKLHDDGKSLPIEQLVTLGHRVEGELSSKTKLDLHFDYPAAFRPLSRLAKGNGTCGILGIMGVLSTGHYALCGIGIHVEELVFGKVREDSLEDVWCHHPVLKEIREGMPGRLEGICSRCLMKQQCLGSCLAQNYYGAGKLWMPYWFCHQADEEGLFPKSRLGAAPADG